ncbi:MAG: PEGA domain-containing protein [bacterium]|nr:PEGA domain-containing protein [bacterium]
MKRLYGLILFFVIVSLVTGGIVFYARGYRPNLRDQSIKATGIVSIKSNPTGATVFIDGEKKGETDIDISDLKPGNYKVEIVRDGFSPWEKEVVVKKEAVNMINAVLFPVAPSLRALTFTGINTPIASPNGKKIVFSLKNPEEKAGIWSLSLSTSALPSFFTSDLIKIIADRSELKFSEGTFEFSPDSKQVLVTLDDQKSYYLLDVSKENQDPKEVTLDIDKIREAWTKQKLTSGTKTLKSLGQEAENFAASLSNLSFSPDKTKFYGISSTGPVLLYDGKPADDPNEKSVTYQLPVAEKYILYPDNKHLILVGKGTISIMELAGTNVIPIYTGNFDKNLVVPWPDGSKIVIATSLNTAVSTLPNLYAIELR